MPTIYQLSLAKAADLVLNASNSQLRAEGFDATVFNQSKISIPKLRLEETKVVVRKEEISYRNAPPGISFSISGPTTVEYALYSIPMSGDMEIMKHFLIPHIDRIRTYVDGKMFHYKEYSNEPISGNDRLIGEIKDRFKGLTENINSRILKFDEDSTKFHEEQLKPTISQFIKTEIEKRDAQQNAQAKLNPFN